VRTPTFISPAKAAALVLAVACVVAASAGPLLPASPRGNIVFILDGSGSMWGKIEGKAKIDIAKEVLTGLIRDLPAGVDVGLVAYGHRSKSDCADVEQLVPSGAPDKGALIEKVNAISPKGMTPITLSVKMTVEKLKALEGETTVLLVSDGQETCKGDPCALVKQLKASGIKFVMHVIGFDVSEKEKAQLACLAQAGGGRYFAAANAKEFQLASRKVAESVTVGAGPGKLVLQKKVFQPLEKIVVTFTAQPDYADAAWVGLIPSPVPHTEDDGDANDIAHEYIKKRAAGPM
jgi:Ca-activated chloride channel family protein